MVQATGFLAGVACLLLGAPGAQAQAVGGLALSDATAVASSTRAAGNGIYSLAGVAGQPLAGASRGSGLELRSGLWPGPAEVVFQLALAAQWNLVSIPLMPWDPRVSALLAGLEGGPIASAFWYWNGENYVMADRIVPGQAYWVFSRAPAVMSVRGSQTDSDVASLPTGWRLVGPLSPAPFADVPLPLTAQPAHALLQSIWTWNAAGNYTVATTMSCGRGYWVYVLPRDGADVLLGP